MEIKNTAKNHQQKMWLSSGLAKLAGFFLVSNVKCSATERQNNTKGRSSRAVLGCRKQLCFLKTALLVVRTKTLKNQLPTLPELCVSP